MALIVFTSGVWAWSAALLQANNADQLVSGFLFENNLTFQGAIFPLEHMQLIKWPLFMVLSYSHFAPMLYICLTMALVMASVAGLAYVLYAISGRGMAFGLLAVLLSSVLLLVPVQVFDGGVTAPLSMAMLTGRNSEYLVFLGVLALYLKTTRLHSWQWAGTTFLLSLLLASDTLFAYFSVGGALLFGATALLLEHAALQRTALHWLVGSIVAWALSMLWQLGIGHSLTHVISYPLGYGWAANPTDVWHGLVGTMQALALNFGLTPRAGYAAAPAFILNIVTVVLIIYAVGWLGRQFYAARGQNRELPATMSFGGMLLAVAVVAIVGFGLTNQPYAQNARYVTISLFSGFVVLAVWLRAVHFRLPALHLLPLAVVGVGVVLLAAVATIGHNNGLLARDALAQRNQKIAAVLRQHHVEFLVGNYWRVIPIRALTPQASQAVSPQQGCVQKIPVLTSSTWRPDLLTHSFAYLLINQSLGAPQQACSKQLLIQYYGQPTSEVIIAGSKALPSEELLFYDNGAASKPFR